MTADFASTILAGKEKMATSSVAIAALIRDGEHALKRNIPSVDKLMGMFKEAKMVIVENDSVDNTKALLREWSNRQSNLHLMSQDFGTRTIVKVDHPHPKSKYFSFHRVEKMSFYRNLYLDYIKDHLEVDFLIVIDLDVSEIDLEGICHSFGWKQSWDAMSANGKKLTPRNLLKKHYFDTYALIREEEELPQTYPRMLKNQKELAYLKKGMEPLKVRSAFNGMCIYQWDSVKGFKYEARENGDDLVVCLCEHTDLHLKMEAAGFDKHYINPSMMVNYEKDNLGFFYRKLKEKLFDGN